MNLLTMMAATSLPNYLAGNGDLGSWEPTQIFAGEADIVTEGGPAGADIAIYQVIAKNAAGAMVPYNPTTPDAPEATAIGIAAQPAKSGQNVPYYIGGVFNHAALGWPSTVDTLVKRQAVFDRTNIHIGNLY